MLFGFTPDGEAKCSFLRLSDHVHQTEVKMHLRSSGTWAATFPTAFPYQTLSFVIICHVIPGSFEKVAGTLHSSASRTSWTTVQGELGRTPPEDLGWPLAWNQWNQIPSLLRCRLTAFTCGSLKQELCRHGNV